MFKPLPALLSAALILAACTSPTASVLNAATSELSISLDSGTLSPAFDPGIHDYEASSLSSLKPLQLTVASGRALSASLDGKPISLNQPVTYQFASLAKDRSLELRVSFPDKTESYRIHSLPASFPNYSVSRPNSGALSPGYLMLAAQDWSLKQPSYLMILDSEARPVYYKQAPTALADFKQHRLPDGSLRYSYFEQLLPQSLDKVSYQEGRVHILDQDFKELEVLSLQPYHSPLYDEDYPGLPADSHDTLMLGPDHYILLGYYGKQADNVPAAQLKRPGQPKVVAALVQEVKDGQVVFQWDSSQYSEFYANAATYAGFDPAAPDWADYMHINSVEVDPKDQNLILSFRHQNQVVKIDRKSGELLWRLGGKNSDFALSPEQVFTHQHDARLLPDGDLLLFDNGNPATGVGPNGQSKAMRFRLDESNHRVVDFQAWQPIPGQYAYAMGSAQQLANGNLLLGWGANTNQSDVSETDAAGKLLFDLRFDEQVYSYRAFKYPEL